MDMKKILQALDGVAERKVEGANDMKKFLSIVAKEPVKESVITSFEEDTIGGDANAFLIAADNINDLVMGNVDKIKINADERLLKDMMEKFNAFMTAYHAVGKEILQPDMFNDSVGESISEDESSELKTWQVVIMNNYYRGKYSDYSGRYYYVLATSPEEARQVVLDNADAILQDLLSMKSVNGKKILPRSSAIPITDKRIGEIKDGTEAGRMTTAGFKKMFSPQGPMMVKLSGGAVVDVQGQEQGVAEGKYTPASETEEDIFINGKKVGKITKITTKKGMVFYRAEIGNSYIVGADTREEAIRDLKRMRKDQGVAEGHDKWGWHTSVNNGEFMPTKYGNKAYVYLHDLDNEGSKGGPQLVTVNKPAVAKKLAQQFGGKVVKTDLNTYRIVKPAEQGVAEGTQQIGVGSKVYHPIHGSGKVVKHSTGAGADHWAEVKFISGNTKRVNRKQLKLEEQGVAESSMKRIVGYRVVGTDIFIPVKDFEQDGRYYELRGHEFKPVWDDEQGVAEGRLHNPGVEDSPVAQAITRRVLLQRTDLLAKYGPGFVGQAIDDVADSVGAVDEIGSSDVSGWVKQVEWNLKNKLNQYDEPMNMDEASDISGILGAASMVKDYIITAEVDGTTKKFRVRGMTGPRAAKERFLKHAAYAKVLDVKPVEEKKMNEVTLGDYRKKAAMQKAQSQMGAMFARSPEEREKNTATFYKRERGLNRLKARDEAARKAEQERQLADTIARLPELKAEYERMRAEYKSLGGSDWQYADREQNLTNSERKARAMEGPMNNLWRQINAAEKAQGSK